MGSWTGLRAACGLSWGLARIRRAPTREPNPMSCRQTSSAQSHEVCGLLHTLVPCPARISPPRRQLAAVPSLRPFAAASAAHDDDDDDAVKASWLAPRRDVHPPSDVSQVPHGHVSAFTTTTSSHIDLPLQSACGTSATATSPSSLDTSTSGAIRHAHATDRLSASELN
jgi:hypothetical protein